MVDKATRNLRDWKVATYKAKKNSFHNARENEKVHDMALEARLGKNKQYTEKDIQKVQTIFSLFLVKLIQFFSSIIIIMSIALLNFDNLCLLSFLKRWELSTN